MNYIKDKVIIIEKEDLISFPKEFGKNHQTYLDEYAKEKNLESSTMKYIAENGNCIFEIVGPIDKEYYIMSYMPRKLTDMQIYFLESIRDTFKSAKMIEAQKLIDGGIEYYSDQSDEMSAESYFYDIIMQSYFDKEKKIRGTYGK